MRLGLSSAAAPSATLDELLAAGARRGLGSLELVEGHGHGVGPGRTDPGEAVEVARRAAGVGVPIAGYRVCDCPDDCDAEALASLAAFACALDTPILLPMAARNEVAGGQGAARWAVLAGVVATLRGQRIHVLPVLPAGAAAVAAADALAPKPNVPGGPPVPVAWDADPAAGDLAEIGSALVARTDVRLELVSLRGGGPESAEQEGRGVGSLMTRLALSGFDGTVSLSPSSARYRVIWDAWLGRRGGWGCGSKSEDRTLVSLGTA